MGRKNISDQRKKEIVIAFYEVSKSIGLENVSIANLANHMGISKGLVMHYYQNKEHILEDLSNYILEAYITFINNSTPDKIESKVALENFIQKMFTREWSEYVDDGVFYSLYALIYRDKKISNSFKRFSNSLRQVLKSKLLSAKEHSVITNSNIDELNEIIFAMIDGGYFYLGTQINDMEAYKKQSLIYSNHVISLLQFS
ncbi:TetR family transcriptional regulator [Tenacibaculum agarivorans]|uniref:TetR family transcriptional regulator n=1 Tax=Tenacibaculum agarivorans TaxID=1908389 RepID=UPI00094BA203|nr:TetR family transcriptional regulator [Tenacibaculum agarivorans]